MLLVSALGARTSAARAATRASGPGAEQPAASASGARLLPVDSNAAVTVVEREPEAVWLAPTKAVVRFPGGGYLGLGRSEFVDNDDLFGYLTAALPALQPAGAGLRGAIRRVGKYSRVDAMGEPVFTFGDLVLDLITDEAGIVTISGKRLDLRSLAASQGPSHGGLRVPGLGAENAMAARAAVAAATRIKSTLWFGTPGGRPSMRFHAWKKNYGIYWSIGAEIETWGRNFTTARISSRYGHYELGHDVCSLVKTDSDHDSNDDYVDEYESGWGTAGGDLLTGVISVCEASWIPPYRKGTVGVGCADGILL